MPTNRSVWSVCFGGMGRSYISSIIQYESWSCSQIVRFWLELISSSVVDATADFFSISPPRFFHRCTFRSYWGSCFEDEKPETIRTSAIWQFVRAAIKEKVVLIRRQDVLEKRCFSIIVHPRYNLAQRWCRGASELHRRLYDGTRTFFVVGNKI